MFPIEPIVALCEFVYVDSSAPIMDPVPDELETELLVICSLVTAPLGGNGVGAGNEWVVTVCDVLLGTRTEYIESSDARGRSVTVILFLVPSVVLDIHVNCGSAVRPLHAITATVNETRVHDREITR
jgi:hypothetical protein